MEKSKNCKHCEFLEQLNNKYENDEKQFKNKKNKQTNELWYFLMTEVFVYLHNGKDYCDNGKRN